MINATPNAAERLAQAKRELKEVERQIETAAERRREVLREGPADGAAAVRADRKLENLKLWRVRLLDQLDVLPAIVSREESETNWPQTAARARTKLAEMQLRLRQLQAIKKINRSAADDALIDSLIPGCVAMAKHVSFLEVFEANSGRAVA